MPMDMDALRKRKQRRGAGWSPTEGDNKIRVLPMTKKYFTEAVGDFAEHFSMHFFRQDGYDTEVTRCPRDEGAYCPACEAAQKFNDANDPALKKMAGDIGRVNRKVMNIFDPENPDAGVQHFTCGVQVYDGILDFAANPEWGDLFHPETGRDINVHLTPAHKSPSGWNKYSVQPSPTTRDISSLLPDGWENDLDDLPSSIPEARDEADIRRVLQRMGFPMEDATAGKA